ncbi:IscS subfamily cysteine desulfurase [Bacillus sp. CGMCC 1.16607]|uniref:IscS subfamily cysteine desulfurase n=1 Tax=Bacillus sp. CGMCC 1.16607 TaxID=3351842 RepID=UPI0036255B98
MKYFDYAATCPLDQDAAEAYIQIATDYFGNSSSLHDIGGRSAQLLDNCRKTLARILGVNEKGLFFTSGGSESNFLAIEALLSATKKKGNHIITTIAEHSSIHGTLKRLEKEGFEITYLPFSKNGIVSLDILQQSIRSETILIAIGHTNSEIGTIQPIEEIAILCKKENILFHCDFVQGFGKADSSKLFEQISSFSFSSHKFYGPKGTGGVFIQPNINWTSFFPGTTHEFGLRPGTINVPAIAAMTVAAEKIIKHQSERLVKFSQLRERFIETLKPICDRITIHGSSGHEQSPGIIGLCIDGIEGQWLMLECNRFGFAISTGSACQSGMQAPSKTMQAIGLTGKKAKEFIRISFGNATTLEEVAELGHKIVTITRDFTK